MPELSQDKIRIVPEPPAEKLSQSHCAYAELDVTTNFTFLTGASHADELVLQAARLGHHAIAVTDVNTLAGVVRMHDSARQVADAGGWTPKVIIGTRLVFDDGPELLVWAPDRGAYANLCRLLTLGRRRAPKGECLLHLADFLDHSAGLLAGVVPSKPFVKTARVMGDLVNALGRDRLSVVMSRVYAGDDQTRMRNVASLAKRFGVDLVATNAVHYHEPSRRALQDVLTCVKNKCSIQEAGFKLWPNAERYLKSPEQMRRLFAEFPGAISRGLEIAERCTFSLSELRYEYPDEVVPAGMTAIEHLTRLAWEGAAERYPGGIPEKVRGLVLRELELIQKLKFEAYFLTVHDIVQFARSRGILCQGRGSAANSAVCYCIGVTSVNPDKFNLLFERFVSAARNEPPDIDVDFEHERREEVIQYIYEKYGRERAGMTATVITYRGRSAVRDVGKALGLGLDVVDQLAKRLDGWHRGTLNGEQLRDSGVDPNDATVLRLVGLTAQLLGFPRHLSQHTGGMVMTRGPLCEMVPIENASMEDRTVIEWDKDDIDALGILKVDVLALGMLTALSKGLRLINDACRGDACVAVDAERRVYKQFAAAPRRDAGVTTTEEERATQASPLQLHTLPSEDPVVYEMCSDADTIGVFQIESRAQMSMLPRLQPRKFYDLVIEVAIVRPGPIQGNMVHPYLQRRKLLREGRGHEITYESDELRDVLAHTLGVPLFQEQAMRVVMVAAGFTADEADKLRRAMAAWRKNGAIDTFYPKIIHGMLDNGYTREFAERVFEQIRGFGEYGFPESHAASFALLVYASAWMKRHHPAAFCAALLNSQPMGFYAPAQIIRDAIEHGVEVRCVDMNHSDWDCTLEERHEGTEARRHEGRERGKSEWGLSGPAVRLGLRRVKGLKAAHVDLIATVRQRVGRFESIDHLHRATGVSVATLRLLAEADAFSSLGLSRRQALWQVMSLSDEEMPLLDRVEEGSGVRVAEGSGVRVQGSGKASAFPEPLTLNPEPFPAFPEPLTLNPESFLPRMPLGQEVMTDYCTMGHSLKAHPLTLVREELTQRKIVTAKRMYELDEGWVKVAGMVLIRQRPGTASGIVFETLEDETGIVNLIVKPDIYERFRPAARYAGLLQADGYLQREGKVVHVIAKRMFDLSHLLAGYQFSSRDFH